MWPHESKVFALNRPEYQYLVLEKNDLEINTNKNEHYIMSKDGEKYPHKLNYNDIVKELDVLPTIT